METRQDDVKDLLKEVKEYIVYFENEIVKDSKDKINKELAKPKVKSSLEHLRSALEYCVHDIYEIILQPVLGDTNKNIYFPYGKTYNDFRSSICNSPIKELKNYRKDIYNLIESLQSFGDKGKWLYNLCNSTNYNKHNRFKEQKRNDGIIIHSPEAGVLADINDKISLSMKNIIFNGKEIESLEIVDGEVVSETGVSESGFSIINWTNFTFKDSNINVLELIIISYKRIYEFQHKLYQLLSM